MRESYHLGKKPHTVLVPERQSDARDENKMGAYPRCSMTKLV